VLFISTGLVSDAQIKKGSWLLGGDVDFNIQNASQPAGNSYTSSSANISLYPSLGKAIRDNLVLGADLSYLHSQSKNADPNVPTTTNSTFNQYGFGLFLREYKPLGKGFSLFAQERLGGSYGDGLPSGSEDFGHSYFLSLGLTPGLAYTVCGRMQLEASLPSLFSIGYSHQKVGSAPNEYKYDSFGAGTNLGSDFFSNITLGFRFILGS